MSRAGESEQQMNDDGPEEELVLNPFARLQYEDGAGADRRNIRVTTCRRGRGWQTTLVASDERPRLFSLLDGLIRADGDVALELADEDEAELRALGLLLPAGEIPKDVQFDVPGDAVSAAEIPRAELLAARDAFQKSGYVIVPRLIPESQLAALQSYYRALVEEGFTRFGDAQVERRHAVHNERVSRLFLTALTPIVSEVVGAPVKPSYAYFASYREGAVLQDHRDRPQCQFSVSFLIDYAPKPEGVSPWPLWVRREREDAAVALRQSIGDGIFYAGCELYHSRTALPVGHRSTHIFFHYVPVDFSGPLD